MASEGGVEAMQGEQPNQLVIIYPNTNHLHGEIYNGRDSYWTWIGERATKSVSGLWCATLKNPDSIVTAS